MDPEVCARWGVAPRRVLAEREARTYEVARGGELFVVKCFPAALYREWRYPLRVAAALRELGWPTPEVVEEPFENGEGAWVMYRRLDGRPAERDDPRARGRLLAELHASAVQTGIVEPRAGFPDAAGVVAGEGLERWLRRYEQRRPEDGRRLRAARDEAAQWFADHDTAAAPRGVIHSDFVPWNLLFRGDRLTGVLDFEGAHHTFLVADFALAWRGQYDEVIRGYDEVRPLSELEWHLIRPAFNAWMFLGLADDADMRWQLDHLRRRSALLEERTGRG